MTRPRLRLGILGGLGPLASVDFYAKLTALTEAGRDREHLPLALVSATETPDRSAAILGGSEDPLPALRDAVAMLDDLGVECIAITCNTAYHWYDALARGSRARLLHIADGVVRALSARLAPGARVAVLATRGTLASGYYRQRLAAAGFDPATPRAADLQRQVDAVIATVKAGRVEEAAAVFEGALTALANERFDAAVLACTELPVAYAACESPPLRPLPIDATLELAREALTVLGYPVREAEGAATAGASVSADVPVRPRAARRA
jgi:aspartate racemase